LVPLRRAFTGYYWISTAATPWVQVTRSVHVFCCRPQDRLERIGKGQ
jgi:hypothetical protein